MDLTTLVPLAVKASIMLTVFALGLEATGANLLALPRNPALLLRSLLAMNVIMPLIAVALAVAFDLHPAIEIALIALALSPIPPMLPKTQLKAGGDRAFIYSLLVVSGLFAVVFIPLALEVVERIFHVPLRLSPLRVPEIVVVGILAPLCAGIVVRKFAPPFAARVANPLRLVAMVLLALAALAVLASAWPAMVSLVGSGTLVAFVAFIVLGLAVGHLLGGPEPADRTALAFATSSRHPGVALAIASANFPDQKLVLPAVLLFTVVGALLAIPYTRWRRGK